MVRFDWMQDLLEWFDWYLKDFGDEPGLFIEIQSNQGQWRIEERYPPEDMETLSLDLGGALSNVAGGTTTILPNGNFGPIYESEPFIEDVWISGLPRLHIDVSTTTVGGRSTRFWKTAPRMGDVHPYRSCDNGLTLSRRRRPGASLDACF